MYDATSNQYLAQSGMSLPYGSYEVVEEQASVGYDLATWRKTFEIRND